MDSISIRRIDDSGIYTRNACLYIWVHSSWQPEDHRDTREPILLQFAFWNQAERLVIRRSPIILKYTPTVDTIHHAQ